MPPDVKHSGKKQAQPQQQSVRGHRARKKCPSMFWGATACDPDAPPMPKANGQRKPPCCKSGQRPMPVALRGHLQPCLVRQHLQDRQRDPQELLLRCDGSASARRWASRGSSNGCVLRSLCSHTRHSLCELDASSKSGRPGRWPPESTKESLDWAARPRSVVASRSSPLSPRHAGKWSVPWSVPRRRRRGGGLAFSIEHSGTALWRGTHAYVLVLYFRTLFEKKLPGLLL